MSLPDNHRAAHQHHNCECHKPQSERQRLEGILSDIQFDGIMLPDHPDYTRLFDKTAYEFQRGVTGFVRDIMHEQYSDLKISKTAVTSIRQAAEAFMVAVFTGSYYDAQPSGLADKIADAPVIGGRADHYVKNGAVEMASRLLLADIDRVNEETRLEDESKREEEDEVKIREQDEEKPSELFHQAAYEQNERVKHEDEDEKEVIIKKEENQEKKWAS